MINKQTSMISLLGVVLCSAAMIGFCAKTNNPRSSEAMKSTNQDAVRETTDLSNLDTMTIPEIPNRMQGERLSVNGIELYYETFGAGDPLLLIHGGGATIESWFAQIPDFSEKYKVIVPDSRGHGRTNDAEGPINFGLMASDFAALLDHLGMKGVNIVGWSDGGVIGLQMAMSRPDLVRKVVTLGAHARPDGMTAEFKAEVEGSSPDHFPAILVEGYKALSPDGPEHWPVVFEKLKTMWLTLPDFQDEELKRIQCPVLLMVGEQDIVREEESKRIASLVPKAQLKVLKGATHYSPVEIPGVVNETILGFLGEP
jgi:pimeloyl-ACP methyl ester carboxylesterase